METNDFKTCTMCEQIWKTRDDFVNDPDIDIVGYQVNFKELTTGLFLFNHSCGTTMAIPVKYFDDLYKGPVFSDRKTGSNQCPGHCLYGQDLEPCAAKCECAYVREIIQRLKGEDSEVAVNK